MKMKWIAGAAVAVAVLFLPGVSVYYEYTGGDGCARCHEIRPNFTAWSASTHRTVACGKCHESSLAGNLRRVAEHVTGDVPEQIRFTARDVPAMVERCRNCHQQEFAEWQSGPHAVTYARIFLDKEHNSKRLMMDDCLRCHGAHFQGGIRDLVTPVDTRGPWRMAAAGMADMPAIPCLACHQIHRQGRSLKKWTEGAPGRSQEIVRPSLAIFDRREQTGIPLANLPMPVMREGVRPVKMSPDSRQALCYQCHAPLVTAQVGSGDDRTGIGVHEGLSCLACHTKHGQKTRASCATCHPRLSNCGIDVEKMDTTFRDPKSPHNVHFVKCADCHPKGVPKKRAAPGAVLAAGS